MGIKTVLLPAISNQPEEPPEEFVEVLLHVGKFHLFVGYFQGGSWYRSMLPGEEPERIRQDIKGWLAICQQ